MAHDDRATPSGLPIPMLRRVIKTTYMDAPSLPSASFLFWFRGKRLQSYIRPLLATESRALMEYAG
jgi:hypothetical protein